MFRLYVLFVVLALLVSGCGGLSLGGGGETPNIPPDAMDKPQPQATFLSAEVLLGDDSFRFVWTLSWYDLEEFQSEEYNLMTWVEVWSDSLKDYRSTEHIAMSCGDGRIVCNEGESIIVTSEPLELSEEMLDGTWTYWLWVGDVQEYMTMVVDTSEVIPFPEPYGSE